MDARQVLSHLQCTVNNSSDVEVAAGGGSLGQAGQQNIGSVAGLGWVQLLSVGETPQGCNRKVNGEGAWGEKLGSGTNPPPLRLHWCDVAHINELPRQHQQSSAKRTLSA